MTLRTNPELQAILATATSQYDQVRLLDTALTTDKRVKAKSAAASVAQADVWASGVLFRDCALTGGFIFDGANIVGYGSTSNLIVATAVNLLNVSAVLRIEGNNHWVEGTVGLSRDAQIAAGVPESQVKSFDFTFPTNPTTSNSIAISGSVRLRGNPILPDGTPDSTPPVVSILSSVNSVTAPQSLTLTASPTDDFGTISKVEFYRSGVLLGTRTSAPWEMTDSPTYFENGTRHYYAKAYDAVGNMGESHTAPVSISLPLPLPKSVSAVAVGATLVTLPELRNTSTSALTNVPITFGQAFARGAFPSSSAAVGLKVGSAAEITAQLDVRDTYADGSVKHAVISAVVPSLDASAAPVCSIIRRTASGTPSPAVPSDFPGLDSVVSFTEEGVVYSISLAPLLNASRVTWLSGNVVSEWEVYGIPKTSAGVEHSHLHVRFVVRAYKGQNKARVDITVENTWANVAFRQFQADVSMTVGGTQVYSAAALWHRQSARYRKVFWWNATEPTIHIKHDFPYLDNAGIIPHYDPRIVPSTATATTHKNNTITNGAPGDRGTILASMPTTGAHGEIGILPGYAALYILLGNEDSKIANLNQGNLAGGWSIHRRDKATGRVISLTTQPTYPNGVPSSINSNTNPLVADRAHQPDQAFLPYIVTGDIFYMEELSFWAMYNSWGQNPNFRQGAKGLFQEDQPRAQGWCMRTVAHAAWIAPAALGKAEFEFIRKSNVDWYEARYVNSSAKDTRLGALFHQFTYGLGEVSFGFFNCSKTFMDHFFTASIGRGVELGFTDQIPLFAFKTKYVNAMLYGVDGVCWVQASAWVHRIREGDAGSRSYESMREVMQGSFSPAVNAAAQSSNCGTAEMAAAWKANDAWRRQVGGPFQDGVSNPGIGDMDGYSDSPTGYPSNLQIAVAYSAEHKTQNGPEAWEVFMGRSVQPSYNTNPQFAIVPRT